MTDIAIRVSNLTKIYHLYDKPQDRLKEALNPFNKLYHHEFFALRDVSFNIRKGQTVGILGKNGAGKSTLLKIITGVLTATSGNIELKGKIASLLELGAGFNPEMTGIDNIYLNGTVMGYTRKEMDKKLDAIILFADIGEFINQPVKSYSSGMFARLAFAVAINVEPDILIIDEALSVGDMAFQAKCFNQFKEFQKADKTILFVTHSIDLIIKYCQSAILLNDGCLITQGDVKETAEKFRQSMISTLPQDDNINSEIFLASGNEKYNLKSQLPVNKDANIYGSKEAEIIDYAIIDSQQRTTNCLKHNELFTIVISVRFHKDIIDPIIAFTIRSIDGIELSGTNTNYLGEVFGQVEKGEVITVEFRQKMILNSGSFFLALGCTKFENDSLKVFHRIYDAVAVEVSSTDIATGIAFSPTKIKYNRQKNAQV